MIGAILLAIFLLCITAGLLIFIRSVSNSILKTCKKNKDVLSKMNEELLELREYKRNITEEIKEGVKL